MHPWPYPFWIAHRGAGRLAPENTLAALRAGAALGWQMAECDVKLSADGVPFLLHDDTLDRTTNGRGPAGARTWEDLAWLDAGAWHSAAYAGERLPTLAEVAGWCRVENFLLNIEIKPSPGTARRTGEGVAAEAARLWQGAAVPPLLTSFSTESLAGARAAAPELPRGLLRDGSAAGAVDEALGLGCVALVCHHPLWNAVLAAQARAAGLRCLAYTVNDEAEAGRLSALGLDGLITDRVDTFDPRASAARPLSRQRGKAAAQ